MVYRILIFAVCFFYKILCAQNGFKDFYQENRVYFDNNCFYVYGSKLVNESNKNFTGDGYAHNSGFYVSQFDSIGKKKWELVIDKQREYILSSDFENPSINKRRGTFYTLVAFRNVKRNGAGVYVDNYLLNFDSLGNVLLEKKLESSSFLKFNSVFFDEDYIYVTLNKNQLVCEKYDYNFKLIETIANPLFIQFLAGSKIIHLKNNYVSIGPDNFNLNFYNQNALNFHADNKNFCVKKKLTVNATGMQVIPFPLQNEEYESFYEYNNQLFCQAYTVDNKTRLYIYNEKNSRLELLIDTLRKKPVYFTPTALGGILYVTTSEVFLSAGQNAECHPQSVIYTKNNKITSAKLTEANDINCQNFFNIKGSELFIYQVNNRGKDVKVKVFDYEKGVFK